MNLSFSNLQEKFNSYDTQIMKRILLPYRKNIELTLLILAFLIPIIWFFFGINQDSKNAGEIFKSAGSGGLYLIFLLLLISPLAELTKSKVLLFFKTMRRPFGICSGLLIGIHAIHYVDYLFWAVMNWEFTLYSTALLSGCIGSIILITLTLTSNNLSQKMLGKKWKLIQQWSYYALLFWLIHAILITQDWSYIILGCIYLWAKWFLMYKKYAPKST